MVLDSAWIQWYSLNNKVLYENSYAEDFEKRVTSVLRLVFPDFVNPDPMGAHGDGGCDGCADCGRIIFACYGQNATSNPDHKMKEKLAHDFERALDCWPTMEQWIFITNGRFGMKPLQLLNEYQAKHLPNSERPIVLRVIKDSEQFWDEYLRELKINELDRLFPGAPHAQNVVFEDLVDLIDSLRSDDCVGQESAPLLPVSDQKMEFNNLPATTRLELNEGRFLSKRIDGWFSAQSNPELRDEKAAAFNREYKMAKALTKEPSEIMERIYIALGGSDYRLEKRRANAVYAVASYFFDTCDIFEPAPESGLS